jgi:hypothetical protein
MNSRSIKNKTKVQHNIITYIFIFKKPFQNAAFETVFLILKIKIPIFALLKNFIFHISYFIFKKWHVPNKPPKTCFLK